MRYLIWSNDHGMWWRPAGNGYTTIIEEAGRYEREDADRIADDASGGGRFKVQRTSWTGALIEVLPEVVALAPEHLPRVSGDLLKPSQVRRPHEETVALFNDEDGPDRAGR